MTTRAAAILGAVPSEVAPGEVHLIRMRKAYGAPPRDLLPGDEVTAEIRDPKPDDYVFEKIGSGWFFGQVWRSRTRGLCIALVRTDGTYDKRRDSMPIKPDTVFLVATSRKRCFHI